jgi:N-acetylneuraminic acid mutarotase
MAYGWQKAFDTTKHTNNYATSLILSMSAHISHDLFFALTDVFKQHTATKDNKKDFKLVAKVHDKLIADYFENILPYLKADKKWKRQAIRKLAKQAAKGLKAERNKIWNEAQKAAVNNKKLARYSKRHKKLSQQIADGIIAPKSLLKKGIEVANTLDKLTFVEKAFLLNNQRP